MGIGAMIYTPDFTKLIQAFKFDMGGYTDTQTEWRSHKPTFIFSKLRK
jgi:hypothetical protein